MRIRSRLVFVGVVALATSCVSPSRIRPYCVGGAGEGRPGKLVVLITGPNGLPVPSAQITLSLATENSRTSQATADTVGHAVFDVSPGEWLMRVELSGFLSASAKISISSGSTCRVDVLLRLDHKDVVVVAVSDLSPLLAPESISCTCPS